MREIKFRAWSIDECKYYYGVENQYDGSPIPSFSLADYDCFGPIVKCDRFIVEQFSGLLDKAGKDIYEGDIVKDGDYIMLVTWSPRYASFGLVKEGWAFLHYFQEAVTPEQCEVIGNIHENPELLTGDR